MLHLPDYLLYLASPYVWFKFSFVCWACSWDDCLFGCFPISAVGSKSSKLHFLQHALSDYQSFSKIQGDSLVTFTGIIQESYRNHVLFTRVSEKRGGYIRLKEAVNHVLQGDREKSMSLFSVNVLFGCSDLQLTCWQISWPIRPFISNILDKCPANYLD